MTLRVSGIITIVQESRFRFVDDGGRGYLFVLGRGARADVTDLCDWRDRGARVAVTYTGAPDLGAVATRIQEEASQGP